MVACLPMVVCWSRSPDLGRIWCVLVFFLVAALLRWQEVQLATRQGQDISENKASVLPLRLVRLQPSCNCRPGSLPSAARPWWTAWQGGGSEGGFFNKLEATAGEDEASSAPSLIYCKHHGGDGGRVGMGGGWLRLPRWGSAAATGGEAKRRRWLAVVIQDRGGRSALRTCGICNIFNLQACVPRRRPFCVSVVALLVVLTPSGSVPGVGGGGCDVERIFLSGGEGPDCVLSKSTKVLFVIGMGLFVIFLFLEALSVICNPTE